MEWNGIWNGHKINGLGKRTFLKIWKMFMLIRKSGTDNGNITGTEILCVQIVHHWLILGEKV